MYLSRKEPVDDLTTPEDMVSPGIVSTKQKQYYLHHKQIVYIKIRLYFYWISINSDLSIKVNRSKNSTSKIRRIRLNMYKVINHGSPNVVNLHFTQDLNM